MKSFGHLTFYILHKNPVEDDVAFSDNPVEYDVAISDNPVED